MTTTITTVMEEQEAERAKNRVMSIRKKFENLEHLDISAPEIRREPKYLFKRSATTFNLRGSNNRGNDKENGRPMSSSNGGAGEAEAKCKSEVLSMLRKSLRRDHKLVAATTPIEQGNANSQTPTKPTPAKMLVRQSSDPRRASIKRSPAFRVGETHAKSPLIKTSSLSDCGVGSYARKKKNLIDDDSDDDDDDHLTDTLRKALKQPLPPGPPPKKPPRLLAPPSSPTGCSGSNNKQFPIEKELLSPPQQVKLSNINRLKILNKSSSVPATAATSNGSWSKKLANGIKANVNQISAITAAKRVPGGGGTAAGLLCCNNSANVYDDVASCGYYRLPEASAQAKNAHKSNGKAPMVVGGRKSEPIYMEPFQHLTMNLNGSNHSNNKNDTSGSEQATRTKRQVQQQQQRRYSMESVTSARSRGRGGGPGKLPGGSFSMDMGEENEADLEDDTSEEIGGEDSRSMTGSVQTSCSCPEQHTEAVEKMQDLHYLVILILFYFCLIFTDVYYDGILLTIIGIVGVKDNMCLGIFHS